jgi:hypothetical protein
MLRARARASGKRGLVQGGKWDPLIRLAMQYESNSDGFFATANK